MARRDDRQLAPGREPQLPAQPRVQHVVHDRRRGGLRARPAGHARRDPGAHRRRVDPPAPHAQAVQDPHGPRARGRHRRAGQGRGGRGARRAREAALRRARHGGHPRDAGRPADRGRALRGGRRRARHERRRAGRAPARDGRPRHPAPGRRDPLPPPRRLQRQRHGRVAGPRRAHRRRRAADGRLPRDLALLPAPDLRRLAVLDLHDGPRALQGGVRRDPRRDRGREPRDRGPRDALQLDRVQEGPAPRTSPRTSRPGNASTQVADSTIPADASAATAEPTT